MKSSENQLLKALDGGGKDVRFFLFHGPDEAGAADHAARLGRALGADAERIAIDGAALRSDPGRVTDEACSLGLFGGRRWIVVSGATDDALVAAQMLVDAPRVEHPVVFLAPTLRAKSKLVAYAVAQQAAMSFACYIPEGADAERMVAAIGRDQGLRVPPGVARRLMAAAGGDRAVIGREIEKLALYLDAAPDRPRDLDEDAIDALGADLGEADMANVVDAVLEGRVGEIGGERARFLESGGATIPLLRQIVRKLMTMAAIRAEVDNGEQAKAAVKKRHLHFREEPVMIRLIQRWRSADIAAAIDRVRRAERALMNPATNPGEVTADAALVELTRRAARLR